MTLNLASLSTTSDLDAASASLTTLRQLVQSGELELLNEKPGSTTQKTARLSHIASSLESAALQNFLNDRIDAKDFTFFTAHSLRVWIEEQQATVEQIQIVNLELAVTFKEKDLQLFRALLSEKIGKLVVLNLSIDHSLIGGAVIQYSTYRMDASLKSRLERFGESWEKATR